MSICFKWCPKYKHVYFLESELATNGEKEPYSYCPRDRKYRNSTRPNRVTGAGFWKATGTDRPNYSSESTKCIGLKKSLVFYRGKAAKGTKTDRMMHKFCLPSISNSPNLDKKYVPMNEAWAICRIFKKANSNTKRDNTRIKINSSLPFATFSLPSFPLCRAGDGDNNSKPSCKLSSFETSTPASRFAVNDATSMLLDMSSSILGDYEEIGQCGLVRWLLRRDACGYAEKSLPWRSRFNVGGIDDEWGSKVRSSMEFPFSFPSMWDSSSPCPSDLSSYSTKKCYT